MIGGISADNPKLKVYEWTEVAKIPSVVDFRGADKKIKRVDKPKLMKNVREIINTEPESSKTDSSEDRVRSRRQSNKAGDEPERIVGRSSRGREIGYRSERAVG